MGVPPYIGRFAFFIFLAAVVIALISWLMIYFLIPMFKAMQSKAKKFKEMKEAEADGIVTVDNAEIEKKKTDEKNKAKEEILKMNKKK